MSAPGSSSPSMELTGLDGTNPLGFLAALGTLVVARQAGESAACLGWTRRVTWTPVLEGLTTDKPEVFCERLAKGLRGKEIDPDAEKKRQDADKACREANTAVKTEYKKIKKEKLTREDRKDAIEKRVRPLEKEAQTKRDEWIEALKDSVPRPELALGARIDCKAEKYREYARKFIETGEIEALPYLAAFGSDACVEDGQGESDERAIEATPFCFIRGSGGQNFLDTVRKLHAEVNAERLKQAFFEPWVYRDAGLSMRWDPGEDKRYALTDVKPADEGARTVWMANLLAYRSLSLFPCAPMRRALGATAWAHVDDELAFTWPLWEFAAGPDTVRTMLQLRELQSARLDRAALHGRGIAAVFRARRIRFPATGPNYKLNFSPARGLL